MKQYIKIHPKDSVIVALVPIPKDTILHINNHALIVQQNIPSAHKIALRDINKDEEIIKFGYPIGHAAEDIKLGEHVHTHNLSTNLNVNLEYTYQPKFEPQGIKSDNATFKAYRRKNGDVGIRNELWIIPTVGCVNGQAKQIVDQLKKESDVSHIDDVLVLSHPYGCSQLGGDHANTRKALAAAIQHPNAGGVLVLGLGCENNQISELITELDEYDQERVHFLLSQDVEDEVEEGLKIVKYLSHLMRSDVRTEVPVSELKIGLKCGGSDAFSGITANPLLGAFSDWLICQGGTTVLTEVPEMFGAESILMNRAKDEPTFNKIVELINGFKDYFRKNNQVVYENPSPGNKVGGITTLEEKSLGAIQKGGDSTIVDVINYGDQVSQKGLNLLWSPGNDLVSSSALAMAGCHMVLFTTGRGTPFGSFVPTVKIASNSELFQRKKNWMDFNAGEIVKNKANDEVLTSFIHFLLDVANGQRVKHEKAGTKELAIFKSGVTL